MVVSMMDATLRRWHLREDRNYNRSFEPVQQELGASLFVFPRQIASVARALFISTFVPVVVFGGRENAASMGPASPCVIRARVRRWRRRGTPARSRPGRPVPPCDDVDRCAAAAPDVRAAGGQSSAPCPAARTPASTCRRVLRSRASRASERLTLFRRSPETAAKPAPAITSDTQRPVRLRGSAASARC